MDIQQEIAAYLRRWMDAQIEQWRGDGGLEAPGVLSANEGQRTIDDGEYDWPPDEDADGIDGFWARHREYRRR